MSSARKLAVAVGLRIRSLREERGWSQERLAGDAGVHRTYMGDVERGERNPSLFSLLKIADALGIHVSDLFSDGDG